jgi:hypothetical protein
MTSKSTCQICGRAIKASKGLIAHHGYQRPNQGWQTRSCFGARYRPYEIACDALPLAIASCEAFIERRQTAIHEWWRNPPDKIEVRRGSYGKGVVTYPRPPGFMAPAQVPTSYNPNTYEGQHARVRLEMLRDIRGAQESIPEFRKRLDDWKAP